MFLKFALTGTGAFLAPGLLSARASRASVALETLDTLLEPIRASHGVPALAGAFVRGSDLVALGAVGVRAMGRPERVQPTDRFHLGSCAKPMTATLLAMLVEQGKLTWEATIADAFGDLRSKIHPDYHQVTLQHLLVHRGGLPGELSRIAALWWQIRSLSGLMSQQRRAFAELVLTRPPAATPGARMLYSNAGYVIAGAFAEQVVGRPWEDLMRQLLFTPLGMTSAGFGPPPVGNPLGHTRVGCRPVVPGPQADNPLVMGPAGTVHAAVADWAKFASLHLRGARGEAGLLLKPATMRHLHRDTHAQGYASGWGVAQRLWAGGTALVHVGTNTMWYASIWIAPAPDAALLAAAKCGSEKSSQACDAAIEAMIRKYL
jgi:CubicO group peptidase (beta-lactamase class C family)